MKNKIDFVILWVDDTDKKWQEERRKYSKNYNNENIDDRDIRYRDYGLLKYWFRGVEKNASWVNKIYFITNGQLPNWLNTNNDKLVVVKHLDYMPKDALPTFNSNAIELLIHKIKGLEEQFVLFNDDFFIIDNVNESDFFKNGFPCNTMSLMPIIPYENDNFYRIISNNMLLINKYFDFKEWKKNNLLKILSIKQGKYLFKTIPFLGYSKFPGFGNFHISISYLKSTFKEVWEKEEELLNKTVYSRFRNNDLNNSQWLFNYWQFAKGRFYQRNYKFGFNIDIDDEKTINVIKNKKYKIIGLADNDDIGNFEVVQKRIEDSFKEILPEKSSFEK